eukprot:g19041.t1
MPLRRSTCSVTTPATSDRDLSAEGRAFHVNSNVLRLGYYKGDCPSYLHDGESDNYGERKCYYAPHVENKKHGAYNRIEHRRTIREQQDRPHLTLQGVRTFPFTFSFNGFCFDEVDATMGMAAPTSAKAATTKTWVVKPAATKGTFVIQDASTKGLNADRHFSLFQEACFVSCFALFQDSVVKRFWRMDAPWASLQHLTSSSFVEAFAL